MNPIRVRGLALAMALLLLVPAAFAQTTGRIDGRTLDESGAALPGVTVTLTSPSLQGQKISVSDADGQFRFLGLPVGVYSLVASLDGYGMIEQSGIEVRLDRGVQVNVELPSAIEETITVSSDMSAVIDRTTTTTGATFNIDLVSQMPLPRTVMNLAFAAPGVVDGGIAGNPSIGGASAAENRYVVDGLDTTDPAFGTVGTTIPTDFIKEVEIKTGGYEAEYGGALGGMLNVVTKSGGNELSIDAFANYTDPDLQSESPATPQTGRFLGEEEEDFGLAIGGKLIEDRLWYFVAANQSNTADLVTTRADLIETKDSDRETLFYTGKLTWQPNPQNQFALSVFGDPTDNVDVVRNAYGRLGTNDEFGADNYGLTYNATLSSSTFLELAAGSYAEDVISLPFLDVPRYQQYQFGDNPGTRFLATNPCGPIDAGGSDWASNFNWSTECVGATFRQTNNDRGRDEIRGNFTWFSETGNIEHEIKVGGMMRQVDYTDRASYPAGLPFEQGGGIDETGYEYDRNGIQGERYLLFDSFHILYDYNQNSVGETDEEAIYAQDSLRIGDYFTVNLGVRADSAKATGELSASFDNRDIDFGFSDMVAPRVGFTWDVTQDGKSKLYGHYGEFYESIPLDINARAFGNELFELYYFYYPSDGSLPTASNPGTWFYSYVLGDGTGVDDNLKAMYTDEMLIGYEYALTNDIAVGIKYTERGINNVIEDISVDGGHTYYITNPTGTYNSNPVTGEALDEPAFFPDPIRDYEAIELTLNKRFSNNWQMYASYVNSENYGNYGGLFRQDNGQLDPNITSLYDLPDLLVGAEGLLPNDREHQFKFYGSYVTPIRLSIGWFGQFLSGVPISKLGGHPIYGDSERFVTPRGSAGRVEDMWKVDLHFEFPIQIGESELRLVADVFNITDESAATAVDNDWTYAREYETTDPNECGGPGTGPGTACPAGNPDWGSATAYQRPQTIRLGVKFSR